MKRRTGRRPGKQDTREAILTAARQTFAERGYDGATIRSIATSAGVDPALVHHYFGNKEQLFTATMNFPASPRELVTEAFGEGLSGAGERLVRMFLRVWDSPAGAAGVALLRSAVSNERGARLMREFVTTQLLHRAMQQLDIDPAEAPTRAALVASQMAGLAVTRYLLRIEPLATAPAEAVVPLVAPTVQRYLADPLPTLLTTTHEAHTG